MSLRNGRRYNFRNYGFACFCFIGHEEWSFLCCLFLEERKNLSNKTVSCDMIFLEKKVGGKDDIRGNAKENL